MTRDERLSALRGALGEVPLMGILRGCPARRVVSVAEEAVAEGVRVLEVTMDSEDAVGQIVALRRALGDRAVVGAGTITSADRLAATVEAGSAFGVTPYLCPDVMERAHALGLPMIPGALTPTEIATAWHSGAAMVKVFPAGPLGPRYLQALRGPLRDLPLVPTGGITADLAARFLRVGATAVGMGADVFDGDLMSTAEMPVLRERVHRYLRVALAPLRGTGRVMHP